MLKRRLMFPKAALASLVLSGCGSGVASVSDFAESAQVSLIFSEDRFEVDVTLDGCSELNEDIRAEIDGAALEVKGRGGEHAGFDSPLSVQCGPAVFFIAPADLRPLREGVLRFFDRDSETTVIAPDVFVERKLEPTAPVPLELVADREASLRLSPADTKCEGFESWFRHRNVCPDLNIKPGAITCGDGSVRFSVPAPREGDCAMPPWPGRLGITIAFHPKISSCGAATCTALERYASAEIEGVLSAGN